MRRELVAQARATVHFETRQGEQMQIDFGVRRVEIGGVATAVFLFVANLGFSRRRHVRAYRHEKQDSWFDGLESAFRVFGGVPEEVLLDNARALILHHDAASREVVLHPRLHAGREVAVHAELKGRHGRSMQDVHLAGVAGADGRPVRVARPEDGGAAAAVPALLRPLAEYEAVVG